ncbi:AI-2E family transporter [Spirosoma arcticum]
MSRLSRAVHLPSYVKFACVLVTLVIIIYGLYTLQDTLVSLVFAILFSVILFPLCNLLERWRFPRVAAILVCIVLTIAFLYGFFYLISLQIGNFTSEAPKLIQRSNEIFNKIQKLADENFNIDRQRLITEARNYLNRALQDSGTILTSTLLATTNTLSTIALLPLYIFFFLLYRDFFRSFFYKVFSDTRHSAIDGVFDRIYAVIKDYVVGLVLVIGVVGVLNTVGLLILGVEFAVFFGFLGAFLILIPYIGIAIGSVLPALYTLVTHDNPLTAAGVVGVFLFVQLLEGNFITPYIVGSKVSINPLASIIALLLWGQLWGLPGLILALPMTAILKVVFDSVDALKPYGFLIGEAEKPRPPIKNLQQLANQLPHRKRRAVIVDNSLPVGKEEASPTI